MKGSCILIFEAKFVVFLLLLLTLCDSHMGILFVFLTGRSSNLDAAAAGKPSVLGGTRSLPIPVPMLSTPSGMSAKNSVRVCFS